MSEFIDDALKHVKAADAQLEKAHEADHPEVIVARSALASAHLDMARTLISLSIEDEVLNRKRG